MSDEDEKLKTTNTVEDFRQLSETVRRIELAICGDKMSGRAGIHHRIDILEKHILEEENTLIKRVSELEKITVQEKTKISIISALVATILTGSVAAIFRHFSP